MDGVKPRIDIADVREAAAERGRLAERFRRRAPVRDGGRRRDRDQRYGEDVAHLQKRLSSSDRRELDKSSCLAIRWTSFWPGIAPD